MRRAGTARLAAWLLYKGDAGIDTRTQAETIVVAGRRRSTAHDDTVGDEMAVTAEITERPSDDQFARVDRVKEYAGQPILDGDDRYWILGAPLVVALGDGELITVPVGFTTDGASIPERAQRITRWRPFEGPQRWAGIVHDWLYHQPGYDKRRADDVFRAVLRDEGASWFRTNSMYWAVRLFGRPAYERNQARGPDARIWVS